VPLPASVPLVTITGDVLHPITGAPATGTVAFTIPVQLATNDGHVLGKDTSTFVLVNGALPAGTQLPATDSQNITPRNWVYTVTATTDAGAWSFQCALPSSPNTVAFSALIPVVTPPATATYVLLSSVGAASGVASLDGTGKVPVTQLPPSTTGVQTVTAGDATIVVGGTSVNPTVAVNNIAESKVTGLIADLGARATKPIVRSAYVTTGDVTLPNTAGVWQPLLQTGGARFEIAIPAAVGDWVEIGLHAMRNTVSSTAYVDVAVITGAGPTIARYLATGSSTPGLEGDPGWYPQSTFENQSAPRGFTVTAGDLDTGSVRFALVVKAGGTGTLYASTNYPLYWMAKNLGAVN
jgi:hypothetical protein